MKRYGSITLENKDFFVFKAVLVHRQEQWTLSAFQYPSGYSKGLIQNPPQIKAEIHLNSNSSGEGSWKYCH